MRILVTGASSGLGELIARSLVGDGHRVSVCARHLPRITGAHAFRCDVTEPASIATSFRALGDALDAVINCAGSFGEIGSVEQVDTEAWWHTVNVNLRGTMLVSKAALPLLRRGSTPRIVNFAGGGAFDPFPHYSAYACAKAAVVRLTECMAAELGAAVRVNAVSPGFQDTAIHHATLRAGRERAGAQFDRTISMMAAPPSPLRVVDCVRALLSPEFNALTGKTISANFDPWDAPNFIGNIAEIMRSDLFALRRVNIRNLTDRHLRRRLE